MITDRTKHVATAITAFEAGNDTRYVRELLIERGLRKHRATDLIKSVLRKADLSTRKLWLDARDKTTTETD